MPKETYSPNDVEQVFSGVRSFGTGLRALRFSLLCHRVGFYYRHQERRKETSMSEENKAVARREFEEMYNQGGNLDAAEEIYAPTSSATSLPAGSPGAWRVPSSSPLATVKPSPT